MKCRGKPGTKVHELLRAVSRFPRYTFHVISQKVHRSEISVSACPPLVDSEDWYSWMFCSSASQYLGKLATVNRFSHRLLIQYIGHEKKKSSRIPPALLLSPDWFGSILHFFSNFMQRHVVSGSPRYNMGTYQIFLISIQKPVRGTPLKISSRADFSPRRGFRVLKQHFLSDKTQKNFKKAVHKGLNYIWKLVGQDLSIISVFK